MKLQPLFFYKVKQVLTVTAWWIIIGILVELHNAVNYDPVTKKHFLYFVFGNNAVQHLLITAIGPLVGGLLAGSFIIFYQREKLKGKTYRQKLLIHSALYIGFVSFCILITGVVGAQASSSRGMFYREFLNDVLSLRVLRLLITWYFIVLLTIFLLDVSEKYGSGTLLKLLLGKFYQPGREERIFMFLDLKSSTTIAEQIGEEKYFRMLRFFYEVAGEAVINTHGEIYQYVGDEIVVSWEHGAGLTDASCLACFYAVQQAVRDNEAEFMKEYGVVPAFKAGLHTGPVAMGEIGTVKKDIVYSGDVLNTAARIVALCNHYKEELLISETLYETLKNAQEYEFTFVDKAVLRGKSIEMELYAVRSSQQPVANSKQ